MLGAVGPAYATRPQFAAFLPAFLVGALLVWAVDAGRPPFRRAAARLWPTLASIAATAACHRAPARDEFAAGGILRGVRDLWREYDPCRSPDSPSTPRCMGAVPVRRPVPGRADRGRRATARSPARGERAGAFVAAFLTVNVAMVLIAAAFATTPYGYLELHDRYLFYLAPLWVVASPCGSPAACRADAADRGCLALALALPAILPFGLIGGGLVIEVVPTALWSWTWTVVEGTPHLDGRRVLGLCVIGLVVATAAVPRRAWPVLPALVAAGMILSAGLAWGRETREPVAFTLAAAPGRAWVDDTLPSGARVAKLYLSPPLPVHGADAPRVLPHGAFNGSIYRVAAIGDSAPTASDLAGRRRRRRAFVPTDGNPLVARYVVTSPGSRSGESAWRGTGAGLVLWQTRGPVALADRGLREGDLVLAHCR